MATDIVIASMTQTEAKDCVRRINEHLGSIRSLLFDLYKRRGWEVLGYKSWRDCVLHEFPQGQSQLYRQLDAAEVECVISPRGEIGAIPEKHLRPLVPLESEEQEIVWKVVQDTAPAGKVTASHVKSVVNVFKEVLITNAIDDGSGEQIKVSDIVKAAVTEETYERMKRQQEHILENGKHKPKTNRAGDEYVPQGFDMCQTPPEALDVLLPYLNKDWIVWECAAGEGLLVEGLYDSGFKTVINSDLLTGSNFFEYAPDTWDCLVTNPPYSLKYKWLERCYQLEKPFALLLPVETLGAKGAQEFFRQCGVEVIFLDRRINFKMPNKGWEGSGAQFPVAWFTYGLNIGQQMTFARIDNATE